MTTTKPYTAINLRASQAWLDALDDLVGAAGCGNRGEYLDGLIEADAARRGAVLPPRLEPSKFNGYANRKDR